MGSAKLFLPLLFGTYIYYVASWLIFILISKFGSYEALGMYSVSLALCMPVVTFFNFNLREMQANFLVSKVEIKDFIHVRVIASFISFFILCAVVVFYESYTYLIPMAVAVFAYKITEMLNEVPIGFHQSRKEHTAIFVLYFSRALIIIAFVLAALIFFDNLTGGLFLASLVLLVITVVKFIRISEPGSLYVFSFENTLKIVKKGWVMGLGAFITSLIVSLPRLFLEHYEGSAAVGVYTALTLLPFAGSVFIVSLGHSMSTSMAISFKDKEMKRFTKQASAVIGVSLLAGLVLTGLFYVMPDFILNTLFSSEMLAYSGELIYFGLFSILLYLFNILIFPLLAMGIYLVQFAVSIIQVSLFTLIYLAGDNSGIHWIAVSLNWSLAVALIIEIMIFYYALKRAKGSQI